ncbi:hypothetical protein CRN76_05000 [Chryseobacterium indologenes]|uniref:tetratricopeptide repeat protein n=1 Tax=Chryseobacterium indologenes TaxID=253 RepID=UPI000BFE6568|nr:tetratricopeptide repeat protein [Chryseobacterium indologenes]ATN04801.1 hypothetical protein CRN76_05000 [Chryseobacterium indologenes]AYY86448.1 tetratricopeptide repeat protein [Chryseobacterium indologenes]QIX83339.1 tetratricopeptide repeat protein [Chryseobacterium indologenes]UDQ53028.1 tetratricopeptide repeat protein [Chryseobacterium indologenes]
MIRIFLSMMVVILISCNQGSTKYQDTFDVPLLTQNEKFRLSGEYDSLVHLNKRYYKKAEQLNYQDGKALCYINLAELNISSENYQKSQFLFDNAKEILDDSENNIHKAKFYNVYGRFNAELKKMDKAFEYNNEALSLVKKSHPSELTKSLLFNIYLRQATYLIERKNYKEALQNFQKAGKLDTTGYIDCAISDYIYMYKNMDSAYAYISKAYSKMERRKKEDGIALYINTILGEYYLADGQYDKAEEAFKRSLEIDKKTRRIFVYYTKYIYNDLRSVYEKKGQKEKAYFYLKAYTEAKNKTNTALLNTINQDMESFISETKQDAENHKTKMQWVIFLSLATFSLLGIYSWSIISRLRKRKRDLRIESQELKNKMNDNTHGTLMELARKNDPQFLIYFKKTHPDFIRKLLNINPSLEDSELTFCALLRLHFTSKEIASYTVIQHKTVQQKKYRLRKKLNIPTEVDIYQFLDSLD